MVNEHCHSSQGTYCQCKVYILLQFFYGVKNTFFIHTQVRQKSWTSECNNQVLSQHFQNLAIINQLLTDLIVLVHV